MIKLLIIEEDSHFSQLLIKYFRKEGFICESVCQLTDVYRKIINYDYDCILLDLSASQEAALKWIRTLTKTQPEAAIIVLSTQDNLQARIAGLEEGADDYLLKPIHLSELNARIKAIIRRKTRQADHLMDFGLLKIKPESREVTVGDHSLQLTRKEYEILVYLARHKNRIVTKDAIAEHLWGDGVEEALSFDFIYTHVKNLRKKLQFNGCTGYLKTVYGIGYKFATG